MLSVRIFVVALIASLSIVMHVRAQSDDREFIGAVRDRLATEGRLLGDRAYQSLGKTQIDLVDKRKSKTFALQLATGTSYAIVVACDNDCSHTISSLRDATGSVVLQSPEVHHTIIIVGTPSRSARYELDVSVPGCSEEECYVGFMLLQKTVSKVESAPSVRFSTLDNYDVVGADLRHMRAADKDLCEAACRGESKCVAYSFNKWNEMCFIKTSAAVFRLEPSATSAFRADLPKPRNDAAPIKIQRYLKKAFPLPKGVSATTEDTLELCQKRCYKEHQCVAFTFFRATRQCFVLGSVGVYVLDERADSGVKRQEPPAAD
jgi:PAN domain